MKRLCTWIENVVETRLYAFGSILWAGVAVEKGKYEKSPAGEMHVVLKLGEEQLP